MWVQVDAAVVLLRYGADVNIQCPPRFDRRRALDFAVMVGSLALTKLLLDAGASVTLPPDYSLTPLHSAVLHDRPDVSRLLLDRHADPNELSADGCSALQVRHVTHVRYRPLQEHRRHFALEVLVTYLTQWL